jgi:uncharacterized membrane protein YphA (DoxX/SURF4 family)
MPACLTTALPIKTDVNTFLFPKEKFCRAGIFTHADRSVQWTIDAKGDDMNKLIQWFLNPPVDGLRATILLRLMAGTVFLWEGLMKFAFPNQGVGRFTKLGFPVPHFTATADAWLEIVGGTLLLAGFLTRLIAVPFIIEMLVAMASTKIPLYLGTSPLPLPPVPPQVGFWAVLHEIRSEYAQLLTVAFLLLAGPGRWSFDWVLAERKRHAHDKQAMNASLRANRPRERIAELTDLKKA